MCVHVQVCIPFLLFCVGVDPKQDLSRLPSILADLGSRGPAHTPPTPNRAHLNVEGKGQVAQNKENVPTSGRPADQQKTVSGSTLAFHGRSGQVLSLLSSSSHSSSGKKKSDRYQSVPKLSLVLSGCHAVLLFLGYEEKLQGSLLDTGSCSTCTMYVDMFITPGWTQVHVLHVHVDMHVQNIYRHIQNMYMYTCM